MREKCPHQKMYRRKVSYSILKAVRRGGMSAIPKRTSKYNRIQTYNKFQLGLNTKLINLKSQNFI